MPDTTSHELVGLIKRLAALLHQNIDTKLKPYGLARSQYVVLRALYDSDTLPTSELVAKLQVEPATMSGLIDVLQTKGLAVRIGHVTDKRRKDVQITPEGRKLVDGIPPPGPVIERVLRENVNRDDVHILRAVGQQMIMNLEAELHKQEGK